MVFVNKVGVDIIVVSRRASDVTVIFTAVYALLVIGCALGEMVVLATLGTALDLSCARRSCVVTEPLASCAAFYLCIVTEVNF